MSDLHTFLMARADYFSINYVINPWMQHHVGKVNQAVAKQQWQQLYQQISQYAKVELLDAVPELPDLVFCANAGFVKDKRVILSRFSKKERAPEEIVYKSWFERHGYELLPLPATLFFEGCGDALFQMGENLIWFGHGIRSDIAAQKYIGEYFETKVISLELIDERFYHLDTCFCPLHDGYVMYYPAAFSAAALRKIKKIIPAQKRLEVLEQDALTFACNAVAIESSVNNVIILHKASHALGAKLAEIGYQVIQVNVSEFMKAGGATKCMTLLLND